MSVLRKVKIMSPEKERNRGEPLYVPDHNPHNSIIPEDRSKGLWRCTLCNQVGKLNDLMVGNPQCTYEYPPCSFCGLTPICAWDCKGVGAILSDPSVYLAGGSKD